MALRKDVKGLEMPWEDQYGYVQAVKVDNTIYVSGQLSHDDQGNMVGAAPLYGNASKLVGYGARPDGSLEEITSVTIPYNSPQGLAGF